jgi:F420-0:gamma-glutamyl ligase-like protein
LKTRSETPSKIYKTIPVITGYWRPGEDYLEQIVEALRGKVHDADIVTVSEKAISTASRNIVDESPIQASSLASFLANHWMRLLWGRVFGSLCHLRGYTIRRFRNYPLQEGAKHKQLALERAGFLQALMPGSEGGIDGSNLPYSYVSLTIKDPEQIAKRIRHKIRSELGKEVAVMIVDTDKTFTCLNFHFTTRPVSTQGISSHGGIFAYVVGRFFKLRMRATPIAVSGIAMSAETALHVAAVADRTRGYGAGRSVWEMADTFDVSLTKVTWEMLDKVEHKPIVIVRPRRKNS